MIYFNLISIIKNDSFKANEKYNIQILYIYFETMITNIDL